MRVRFAILVVLTGLGALAVSGCAHRVASQPIGPMPWVSIAVTGDIRPRAAVGVTRSAPYQGGPAAGVPAEPLRPGAAVTTSLFMLRAWQEAKAIRVVIFAVAPGGPLSAAASEGRETQISTFTLSPGQTVTVSETEQYGAAHVIVSLSK